MAQDAYSGPPSQDQGWQNNQTGQYSDPNYNGPDSSHPDPGGAPYGDSAATRQPLTAGQLEQLVAPIALYPDALVAQVLAASTYPQQVMDADRWRQQQGYAPADAIVAGADAQNWDPSVKALTAFPQVLAQMDRNQQWMADLGNAYFNQPQDVLEAVQIMRRRAQAAGNLRSTPQEIVNDYDGNIQLMPARPQVVYVPTYNPWAVYGEPLNPYPGFSLFAGLGEFLGSGVIRYGLGIAVSAFTRPWGWLAWGLDWLGHALLFDHSDYYGHLGRRPDWGFEHHRLYAYSGRGGFGRGDREYARGWNGQNWGNRNWGGEGWRHTGSGAGWRSFDHGAFDRRSLEQGSLNRGSERRMETWGAHPAPGMQSFRGERQGFEGSRAFPNRPAERMPESRGEYAFNRGGFGSGNRGESYRGANNFSRGEFGGRSYNSFASSSGKSHGGGSHWFGGGHSERSFGGGHSSFGGGHAPKGFGKSSRGGHSFGGGHSHGGGKHHR